jgi:hypothetical protein
MHVVKRPLLWYVEFYSLSISALSQQSSLDAKCHVLSVLRFYLISTRSYVTVFYRLPLSTFFISSPIKAERMNPYQAETSKIHGNDNELQEVASGELDYRNAAYIRLEEHIV